MLKFVSNQQSEQGPSCRWSGLRREAPVHAMSRSTDFWRKLFTATPNESL